MRGAVVGVGVGVVGGSGAAWRRWPPTVQDGVLALVVAVATFLPVLRENGVELSLLPERRVDAAAVVLALGEALPLVWRRTAPALCLAVVAVSFALYQAAGYASLFTGVGLLVALVSAGAHLRRHRRTTAACAAAAYAVLAVVLHALGSPERAAQYVTFGLVLAGCWVVGARLRARAVLEVERRERTRLDAAAAERALIARELHDVITHHVTAMVVQAEAAAFLTSRPEQLGASLGRIAGSGREALTELRHQLGVLGSGPADPARSPVVGRLQDLVEGVRASGLAVELVERGTPGVLGDGVALAVHRVVQECLTNALKHAPGRATTVCVSYGDDAVDVTVTTAGGVRSRAGLTPGRTGAQDSGSGRGLAGMRERVAGLGGDLRAGPTADGGFEVRARIPSPASGAPR